MNELSRIVLSLKFKKFFKYSSVFKQYFIWRSVQKWLDSKIDGQELSREKTEFLNLFTQW